MRAIVTVIGKDRVGIIATVCNVLSKHNVNVLDISQTVLQEYFTMIMLVDLTECTLPFDELAAQLKAKGEDASFEEILTNVKERDYIDQNREVSPLRKADDALLLDNSNITIEEQKQWLKERFEEATK